MACHPQLLVPPLSTPSIHSAEAELWTQLPHQDRSSLNTGAVFALLCLELCSKFLHTGGV